MSKSTLRLFQAILVLLPLMLVIEPGMAQVVAGGGFLLVLLLCLQSALLGRTRFKRGSGLLPLVLLVLLVLIQLIPLPPGGIKLLSPTTWQLYSGSIWIVSPSVWMPLSVNPAATVKGLFLLSAWVAAYLATQQILAERQQLKQTAMLVALGCGVAFLLGGLKLLWLSQTFSQVGRAPFASAVLGLAVMMLPVILGLFFALKPQVRYATLRETLVDMLGRPEGHPFLLLIFSAGLAAIYVLLTLRFWGAFASLAALLMFGVLLMVRSHTRRRGVMLTLSSVILLTTILLTGTGSRFSSSEPDGVSEIASYSQTWKDGLQMVSDFPVAGTGLGTFETIASRYRTAVPARGLTVGPPVGLLTLLTGGGPMVLILGLAFLVSLFLQTFPAWRARRNHTAIYLFAGSLAGIWGVVVLGLAGQSMDFPTYGSYGFFLAGLAATASRSRALRPEEAESVAVLTDSGLRALGGSAMAVSVGYLLFFSGEFLARHSFAPLAVVDWSARDGQQANPIFQEAALRAVRYAPLESRYRFARARLGPQSLDDHDALALHVEALRLDPLNSDYLQANAMILASLGQGKKAESLLQAGVDSGVGSEAMRQFLVVWYLENERLEAALNEIRRTLELFPEQAPGYLALMNRYGLQPADMKRALPERSIPLIAMGDFLAAEGKEDAAEASYHAALIHAAGEARPSLTPFWRVHDYFAARGKFQEALEALQAAVRVFPESPELRGRIAGLYESMGITYRAIEEYRKTLLLDPGNHSVRTRLEELQGNR